MTFYQQGDVLLIPTKAIPDGAAKRHDKHLAEGELTGHFHAAMSETADIFELPGLGRRFLSAPGGTVVKHQEHKPIVVPPGDYEVRIVQEYDHFAEEARAISD